MSRYRTARSGRGSPALVIGLVVLGALLIGFVLGSIFSGDGGDGVGEGSPAVSGSMPVAGSPPASGSAPASMAPGSPQGSAPPPVVAAPEGVLPPGSVVRVLADGLRMRDMPSTDGALVQNLPLDQLLGVTQFGPVTANGFAWYPVVRLGDLTELPPLPGDPIDPDSAGGWVAASDATGAFVELVAPRCPPRPVDLTTVAAMLAWERLACFGNEQLTLEGTYGCAGCPAPQPGTFEPAWLANPVNPAAFSVDPNVRIGPFAVRFPPSVAPPQPTQILRVVGHFDDPAAPGCTVAPGDPPVAIDQRVADVFCREQFVVESIEVLGTDPDFPSG